MNRKMMGFFAAIMVMIGFASCGGSKQDEVIAIFRDGRGRNYEISYEFFNNGEVVAYDDENDMVNYYDTFYRGNPKKPGWVLWYQYASDDVDLEQDEKKFLETYLNETLQDFNTKMLPDDMKDQDDIAEWMESTIAEVFAEHKLSDVSDYITMKWPFLITKSEKIYMHGDAFVTKTVEKQKVKANTKKRIVSFVDEDSEEMVKFYPDGKVEFYEKNGRRWDLEDELFGVGEAYKDGWVFIANAKKSELEKKDLQDLQEAFSFCSQLILPNKIRTAYDFEFHFDRIFLSLFTDEMSDKAKNLSVDMDSVFDDLVYADAYAMTLSDGKRAMYLRGHLYFEVEE